MKLTTKMLLSSLVISTIMIGCGSSSDGTTVATSDSGMQSSGGNTTNGSNNSTTTRFATMSMNNQTVTRDVTINLEWVNGPGGCHPMVPGKTEEVAFDEAEAHCQNLDFAGHTDWRVPKIGEIQTFTVEMQNANLQPFYQNPACPRVVGYNADKTQIQNTNTHNTPPIGTISDWDELNAGVRCVRDVPAGG